MKKRLAGIAAAVLLVGFFVIYFVNPRALGSFTFLMLLCVMGLGYYARS